MTRFQHGLGMAAAASLLLACGDSTGPPPPTSIQVVSGTGQTAVVGSKLPNPLIVRVLDAGGRALSGVAVEWSAAAGGGTVSATAASTDATGQAQAQWTLGTAAGEQRAQAAVSGLAPAAFTAMATADRPASIKPSRDSLSFNAVGDTVRLMATVTDRHGNAITSVQLQWSSSDTAVARVDAQGLVTSRGTGRGIITAAAEGAQAAVPVAVRQVVTRVQVSPAADTVAVGDTARLRATALDANGVAAPGASFAWSSSDNSVATVDATGLVRGIGAGSATITAATSGVNGSASLRVAVAPTLSAVSPDTLLPGGTATITGSNFGAAAAENTVTVDGVAVTVTAANTTQLTVTLPARSAFTCQPTGAVTVAVARGGVRGTRSHPLRVPLQRSLAAGQSLTLLPGQELRCNEFSQTGGRYFLSAFNTSTLLSSISAFQLRGVGPGGAAPPVAAAAPTPPARRRAPAGSPIEEMRRHFRQHQRVLELNQELFRRLGTPKRVEARGAAVAPVPPPAVGDTLSFRVPNINSSANCTNFTDVRARTIYSGSRGVVLEDISNPLAGTIDSLHRSLGTEFDTLMFAILEANFGNPLAMDARLDNNGRIFMLFTKAVNDLGAGIAGFVFAGDFLDRSQCASSDKAEVFYAFVPTSSAGGFGSGTVGNWLGVIRGVVIHEVKHITSNAERLSRGADAQTGLEETWLEESTAQLAEELWARRIFGYAQNGNTTYDQSLFCEVRPASASAPQCAGKPFVMFNHFDLLYDYLSANETRTVLGGVTSDDFSFYGSGWFFLRWAVDLSGTAEGTFLKALTQTLDRGVANLAARTGRSFPELLADWPLATATDELSGFTPARPQFRIPSWNTRDIFAGMNSDFPSSFPLAFPLTPRALAFGSFMVDVGQLRAGTASIFELTGTQTGTQVIELRSPSGGDPASSLGLAVVRVQ